MELIKTISQPKPEKLPFQFNFSSLLLKFELLKTLAVAWQFATIGYSNRKKKYRIKQKTRSIIFTLLSPTYTKNWFQVLNSQSFKSTVNKRPRLFIKPYLPYISTTWNRTKKTKVLLDSYRFINKKGKRFSEFMLQNEGFALANFSYKKYEGFLKIGYEDRFRKEGEFVLFLECNQLGGKIAAAAFSFEETKLNNWNCLIGCVQGYKENSKEATKIIQKVLFGIRPSALLVFAVKEFANKMGCSSIYGIKNSSLVFRKKHGIHLPYFHHISFNYDQFWKEVGGKDDDNEWFELPLQTNRKNYNEIQSHKRAHYRKRYEMLDNFVIQISERFNEIIN